MATRSAIGIVDGDRCISIYCHWDGYPSHNGIILLEHYDRAKTLELVSLGSLSVLRENIGEKHNGLDDDMYKLASDQKWCSFHCRDFGELDCGPMYLDHEDDMLKEYPSCDYFYVMKNDRWYMRRYDDRFWEILDKEVILDDA